VWVTTITFQHISGKRPAILLCRQPLDAKDQIRRSGEEKIIVSVRGIEPVVQPLTLSHYIYIYRLCYPSLYCSTYYLTTASATSFKNFLNWSSTITLLFDRQIKKNEKKNTDWWKQSNKERIKHGVEKFGRLIYSCDITGIRHLDFNVFCNGGILVLTSAKTHSTNARFSDTGSRKHLLCALHRIVEILGERICT